MESKAPVKSIGVSDFAKRNFLGGGKSRPMFNISPEAFAQFVNSELSMGVKSVCSVVDAPNMPFCQYLFIANFTSASPAHLPITNENAQWLRSDYESRTDDELPVLVRWFDFPCPLQPAKLLMIILYSREQLLLEAGPDKKDSVPDDDWSVVSVIPMDEYGVPPMPPITAFRNALGVDQGGNGVPLNKSEYLASVEYWKTHAMVR